MKTNAFRSNQPQLYWKADVYRDMSLPITVGLDDVFGGDLRPTV